MSDKKTGYFPPLVLWLAGAIYCAFALPHSEPLGNRVVLGILWPVVLFHDCGEIGSAEYKRLYPPKPTPERTEPA
jgi:hypothetical protein